MRNQENIYREGEIVSHWPCDVGMNGELESNGSKELLIKWKENYYLIRTTWKNDRILSCCLIDRELALREGGMLASVIRQAERGNI